MWEILNRKNYSISICVTSTFKSHIMRWSYQVIVTDDLTRWWLKIILPGDSYRWFYQVMVKDNFTRWQLQMTLPGDSYRWSYQVMVTAAPDSRKRTLLTSACKIAGAPSLTDMSAKGWMKMTGPSANTKKVTKCHLNVIQNDWSLCRYKKWLQNFI